MNRPARLIAALTLGAVALLAALPAWLGWRAERTYRALVDGLAAAVDAPPPVHRYRRAWLHSEAESELRAENGATLTVRLYLDHGPLAHEGLAPVMAYGRGEVQLAVPASAAIPPLTIEGTTDLGGTTRLRLSWPAARIRLKDSELAWETLHASVQHERRARRLQTQIDIPRLHTAGERGWRAEGVRLQLDLRPGTDDAPLGRADASAARLVLPDDETIEDGRLALGTRADGDQVTFTADAHVRIWRRHGVAAGPGTFALAVRRLEPAALWPLLRLTPALARGMDDAVALKLAPLAMQFARRAPDAELTALRLGDGPVALDGRGRLAFNADRLGDNVSPGRLLARLAGEFELALPTALAHGWLWAPPEDTGVRRTGPPPPYDRLFAPEQDGYRLRAALKQGRLLVNGEPWHGPLPAP